MTTEEVKKSSVRCQGNYKKYLEIIFSFILQARKISKNLVSLWTRFATSASPPHPRWLSVKDTMGGEGETRAKYAVIDGKQIRMALEQEFMQVGK